jgi:RNA polymerase sigma-70 factor (ECF subfamily)
MVEIEPELVRKAQRGDKASFDRIITAYRQQIINLCRRYMRNDEEACDMAQEAFCSAYTALKSFEHKSKFSTWLYRVAVNLCINRLDTLRRRKYFETDSMSGGGDDEDIRGIDVPDKARLQDEQMEAGEIRQAVADALEGFPEEERNVVILRDMQGLEYEEISGILKMPLGSVKSKLSRAREKLKAKLARTIGEIL